jgi:CRP-like cAMP-binding protein
MKDHLKDSIEAKIRLSDTEYAQFKAFFIKKTVKKKDLLVREGDISRNTFFIEKGAMCVYSIDNDGEMHVVQFGFEGYFIGDLYSFYTGKPALYSIEALEDCEILQIDYETQERAYEKIPKIERFFRLLVQNAYINAQLRIAKTFSDSAEDRYLTLIKRHPDILQRVPQYLVASYLGIKPQSLSRIRKQIFEKK